MEAKERAQVTAHAAATEAAAARQEMVEVRVAAAEREAAAVEAKELAEAAARQAAMEAAAARRELESSAVTIRAAAAASAMESLQAAASREAHARAAELQALAAQVREGAAMQCRVSMSSAVHSLPYTSIAFASSTPGSLQGGVQGWRACRHAQPGCPIRGAPPAAARQLHLLNPSADC